VGSLFDEICAYPTLLLAFDRVEENAGGPGVDGVRIEDLAPSLPQTLLRLAHSVRDGSYRPLPLLRIHIDKGGGKTRPLSIPTVRDRIVQTAAAIVLTPILDQEFESCSYGYRKGRSVQQAVQRIIAYREQGYQWVVDADIQSYFDQIDHGQLLGELRSLVADPPVLNLITLWLESEVVEGDAHFRLTRGVPQGSPISPVLSNLYLDRFDEALLGAGHKLVRFADDFVVLCRSRPQAVEALELTEHTLRSLRLRLNEDKTRIVDFTRGFRYLGVQFLRSMAFRPLYQEEESRGTSEPMPALSASDTLPHVVASVGETNAEGRTKETEEWSEAIPATTVGRALHRALATLPEDQADEVWEGLMADGEPGAGSEPTDGKGPLLRTLYLVEQGAVLAKTDERFVVSKGGATLREVPALKVDQIMVFGNVQITTPAMKFCLTENIPIILLSSRGRYFGALESTSHDLILLHRDQFTRAADPAFILRFAKAVVRGKISNGRVLLQRYARHRSGLDVSQSLATMATALRRLPAAQSVDEVRGHEGAAAAQYFAALRILIGDGWGFTKRLRQPPPDPVNSLLSLGYTFLFYNLYALIRAHGLHPGVGYLHPMHQGHPALVSDLIEEFRAPVVDALVLNLILRGRVTPRDFIHPAGEGLPCLLNDTARKTLIAAFEEKMNSRVTHPATKFQVDYRRCLDL
jgi:CRISPR-associated protein Cas1